MLLHVRPLLKRAASLNRFSFVSKRLYSDTPSDPFKFKPGLLETLELAQTKIADKEISTFKNLIERKPCFSIHVIYVLQTSVSEMM